MALRRPTVRSRSAPRNATAHRASGFRRRPVAAGRHPLERRLVPIWFLSTVRDQRGAQEDQTRCVGQGVQARLRRDLRSGRRRSRELLETPRCVDPRTPDGRREAHQGGSGKSSGQFRTALFHGGALRSRQRSPHAGQARAGAICSPAALARRVEGRCRQRKLIRRRAPSRRSADRYLERAPLLRARDGLRLGVALDRRADVLMAERRGDSMARLAASRASVQRRPAHACAVTLGMLAGSWIFCTALRASPPAAPGRAHRASMPMALEIQPENVGIAACALPASSSRVGIDSGCPLSCRLCVARLVTWSAACRAAASIVAVTAPASPDVGLLRSPCYPLSGLRRSQLGLAVASLPLPSTALDMGSTAAAAWPRANFASPWPGEHAAVGVDGERYAEVVHARERLVSTPVSRWSGRTAAARGRGRTRPADQSRSGRATGPAPRQARRRRRAVRAGVVRTLMTRDSEVAP